MGQDLILAFALDPNMTMEKWAEAVYSLSDNRLAAIWDEVFQIDSDLKDLDNFPEVVRQSLLKSYEYVLSGPRNVVVFTDTANVSWIIGGGTTWGDTPEGYDEVAFIAASGIGQKLFNIRRK